MQAAVLRLMTSKQDMAVEAVRYIMQMPSQRYVLVADAVQRPEPKVVQRHTNPARDCDLHTA